MIAALPEDELTRLRQRNQRDLVRARAEVARLEVQEQQFELAVAKRDRKKPGRPGTLTPEVVLNAATQTEPPMSAADVHETLVNRGLKVSVNAVRNHLNTLLKAGDLAKDGSRYVIATPTFVPDDMDFPSAPSGADIPF